MTRSYIWWISRRKIMIILPAIVILMVLVVALSVMTGTFAVLGKVSNTIKGKTIVIDPGHGGPDPGAVVGQLFEKDINLEVAKKLERLLLKEGAKVVMTRHGDENIASQKVGGRKNRQRKTIDWMRIYLPRMNPTGEAILAPKLVKLAKVTLGQNKPDNKQDLAGWTLASLLEKNRQEAGLFPKGVSVNNLSIRGNLARVDFSKEICDVEGLEAEQLVVASIVKTLTQIQGINQVSITVEGEQLETLQGHVAINEPLTAAQVGKTPKIAVVIDDFGGDVAGVKDMYTFKYPLTIAIMPHLELSRQQAEKAKKEGFQVILHLPMEPKQGKSYWLGPGAITTRMSVEEVRKSVLADLAEIPQAVGFNNHMGSKATADKRVMEAVLQVAKEKKLFVLDSRTTQKTVIPQLAAEIGIPMVHRSIFLDNMNSTAHIRGQMEKAMEEAKAKGSAVVIGHVGPTGPKVVEVLEQMLPQLEEKGIEMVFVSELAKKPAP